ncbi:lysylphosphatidylglycerol synthase domain-containing protein [Paraburkholderia sp.]|uniref:lysylphosphatidylglycerol synthase domain-containing protein n=1 Tax=Paraburkholderia sp. TaxID=1926495 RepID=UPI0025E3FC97|nr:lysylphosphatidylglycerol synthase domain-containing protein [Paraburkholderia sp.]
MKIPYLRTNGGAAIGAIVATSCGLLAAVALVVSHDVTLVLGAVTRAGWSIAAIVAIRAVIVVFIGVAWGRVVRPLSRQRYGVFVLLRWIREAINVLLPVVSVGGDLIGARLLTFWGVAGGLAGASILVDLLVQAFAQFLFTVAGFGLLVAGGRGGALIEWLSTGLAVAAAALIGFYLAQRFWLFALIERGLLAAARWLKMSFGELGLHDNLQRIHANRAALLSAVFVHLTAWFIGVTEIWVALTYMGAKPTLTEAMVLESLGQAVRDAAFPVPGAYGVQEGAFLLLGRIYGLPPEIALALSLIKRVPDVALGLPGLLAWHLLETRRLLSRRRAVPEDEAARNAFPQSRCSDNQSAGVSTVVQSMPTATLPGPPDLADRNVKPVSSWNEWDPLEEVIVGRIDGAIIPPYHVGVTFNVPSVTARLHRFVAGRRYPRWMIDLAQKELDAYVRILEAEGVTVRRPDVINHRVRFGTPSWFSHGFCVACPRDSYLVIGDEIIETPLCWRSRHFEGDAYGALFKEYCHQGARCTAAPRPPLTDDPFDPGYRISGKYEPLRYIVNEFEPVFDAADFTRCGRDLFVTRSNVTNRSGIEWLRRHLGDGFRIHEIETHCRQPMHINSSFNPLCPGKVLVNPDCIDVTRLPPILKSWDVLIAPRPDPVAGIMAKFSMCNSWTSINTLMLDEKRVIVDASQLSLIKAFKDWRFEPIPCAFLSYRPFGGAFHCATLDIRRRGELQCYF